MAQSTLTLFDRLALVFDFDDTLAPDCLASFLKQSGSSLDELDERVEPRIAEGWDPILARMWTLIELSREGVLGGPITRQRLAEHGRALAPFDGVEQMFDRVREHLDALDCPAEVEFYIVSAGFSEIIENTSIADRFHAIYASRFAFDDQDAICFARSTISHTEKTRYLLQIARGEREANESQFVPDLHSSIPEDELSVPFNQMIYVGDGFSDLPCFSLINSHRGVALGVADGESTEWSVGGQIAEGRRVENLAPPDFRPDSELLTSIMLGVQHIAATIELRRLSVGE